MNSDQTCIATGRQKRGGKNTNPRAKMSNTWAYLTIYWHKMVCFFRSQHDLIHFSIIRIFMNIKRDSIDINSFSVDLKSENYFHRRLHILHLKKSWQFGWEFCSEHVCLSFKDSKAVLNTDFMSRSMKITKREKTGQGEDHRNVWTRLYSYLGERHVLKEKKKMLPISFGFMTSIRSIFRGIKYVLPHPTAKATKTEQLKSTLNTQVYS